MFIFSLWIHLAYFSVISFLFADRSFNISGIRANSVAEEQRKWSWMLPLDICGSFAKIGIRIQLLICPEDYIYHFRLKLIDTPKYKFTNVCVHKWTYFSFDSLVLRHFADPWPEISAKRKCYINVLQVNLYLSYKGNLTHWFINIKQKETIKLSFVLFLIISFEVRR